MRDHFNSYDDISRATHDLYKVQAVNTPSQVYNPNDNVNAVDAVTQKLKPNSFPVS